MAVQPEIVSVQLAPPAPIRVIFDSSELLFVEVVVTLTVGGKEALFRLGNKRGPLTPPAKDFKVRCNPDIDTVTYLHEWGDPEPMDEVEVLVTFNGVQRSATAKVLIPGGQ